MAISPMAKVMIVCHRSQASDLLEAVQNAGVMEVLDAERGMIGKQSSDLKIETRRPRDVEQTHSRLEKAVVFLGRIARTRRASSRRVRRWRPSDTPMWSRASSR